MIVNDNTTATSPSFVARRLATSIGNGTADSGRVSQRHLLRPGGRGRHRAERRQQHGAQHRHAGIFIQSVRFPTGTPNADPNVDRISDNTVTNIDDNSPSPSVPHRRQIEARRHDTICADIARQHLDTAIGGAEHFRVRQRFDGIDVPPRGLRRRAGPTTPRVADVPRRPEQRRSTASANHARRLHRARRLLCDTRRDADHRHEEHADGRALPLRDQDLPLQPGADRRRLGAVQRPAAADQPEPGAVLPARHDVRRQRAHELRAARPARTHADPRRRGHTLGERGGEQAHTLSIAELPEHTHVAQATSATGDTPGRARQPAGRLAEPALRRRPRRT